MEINPETLQRVVAIGDKAVIQDKMWSAAIQCSVEIYKANYDYMAPDSFGGHNSNAVLSTLAACMQLEPFKFDGFSPGLNDVILNWETIKVIQAQNGFGQASGGGGDSTGGSGGGSNGGGDIKLPDVPPSGGKKRGGYWQNPGSISPTSDTDYLAATKANDTNVGTLAAHDVYSATGTENHVPVTTVGVSDHIALL